MPDVFDPIAAWRARQPSVVDDPPMPELETPKALAGTAFDTSDPIAAWRRESFARPDPLNAVGRGIRTGIETALRPVRAVAEPLEANADYLTSSIPPEENTVGKASPLSLMKAFGAGINKTVAGMASPAGALSFLGGPVGTAGRALLASQQIPSGVEQTAAGVRERDPMKTAGGVANTALGAALIGGDVARIPEAEPLPGDHAFRGFEAAERARAAEDAFNRRSQPDRALPPAPEPGEPAAPDVRRLHGGDLERLLLGDGGGPGGPGGPGGDPNEPIDGDFYDPTKLLPGGNPPRFFGGEAGTVDARGGADPIAAWRAASGRNRPPAGLLPERAGDIAAGVPPAPPMPLDEYLSSAGLKPGAPLAELEAALYPPPNETTPGQQLGLSDLVKTPEVPNAVQPAAVPDDTGAGAGPTPGERGSVTGAGRGIKLKPRELTPEEEQSIRMADELYDALHGDAPPAGNGTYREEAVSPPVADAAPAGENQSGGSRELAPPNESGMDQAGGPQRGPGVRRNARAASPDDTFLNDLVSKAIEDGYQGDPAALHAHVDERVQLMKEIEDEFDRSGRNPENLLRAIAQNGGLATRDVEQALGPGLFGGGTGDLSGDAFKGEREWLKEFGDRGRGGTVNGIRGIWRQPGEMKAGSREVGKTLSQMAEALGEDPNFSHIKSADDLINELQDALGGDLTKTNLENKLSRAGVTYGGQWWKEVGADKGAADFNPSEFEDTLDTGESQPRLQEAGKVRDVENKTPEFDAPFALSAEADKGPRELEQAFGFDDRPAAPEPVRAPSLDDIEARHDVRNPGKADEIAQSMQRVGWKGRPVLVLRDGDRRVAWTATHRLEAAKRAGLTPADVPMLEVDGQKLRDAGYDLEDLTSKGKKERIEALRAAGEPDAAALLEEERAASQARRSASPEDDVPEDIAPNVRHYLTKQLGYTADEVDAMGPGEATRIGRDQVAHPDRAARRSPAPAPVDALPERGGLPSDAAMESFDETRGARGQQRNQAVQRTAVPNEQNVDGDEAAPPPKTPAERAAAGEQLTTKERQSLNLPEEKPARERVSPREAGSSPRQVEQRVRRMDAWMDDPTPENFRRWVDEVTGQAERVNQRQLKGGTGEEGNMPPRSDSGEVLAGSPFPGFQVLADPRLMRRVAQFLISNEPADRLLRAVIGAGAGAITDQDHRLRGALTGALTGMIGPEIARAWASDFVALAKGQLPKAPAGLPRVYEPRSKGDIGIVENLAGSKAHTIPEQFATVRPAIDALQAIRETGKLDSRLPLLTNERLGDAAGDASAYKNGKLQVRQGQFLAPEIKYLRSEATKALEKQKPRMASYLNAYADELDGVMTKSEKFLRESGVPPKLIQRLATEGSNQVYRQGLALNVGSAAVNRISQPLLTAPYVGLRNLWKNYAPLSESEKGLSEITRPVDQMEVQRSGWKFLQKFDDIASSLMRFSDNHNRQGAYAAAHLAAEQAGAPPRAAYAFARDVSEKTQGLYGLLSGNPRWRGPVIKTLKPFTKYPILFAEWLNDAATSADPRVRWRTAAMAGGVMAFSQATGIDLWDMLAGGARYGGSGMLRAAMDLYAHATNQAKDHKVFAMPGKGFTDSDVGNIAYPVGVRRVKDTVQRFAHSGLQPHKVRTPGGALETVSPTEDVLNAFGVKTTRQTDRQQMLDDAHAHELAAAEDDSQANAQAKRDLLRALDMDDADGAQEALGQMSSNTRKAILRSQNRDRFEKLLHATPVKRRPELRDTYGSQEQELRGPRP